MLRKIEIWILYLVITLFIMFLFFWTILIASESQYQTETGKKMPIISSIISTSEEVGRFLYMTLTQGISSAQNPQIEKFNEFKSLNILSKNKPSGYLLYSAFSKNNGISTIYLLDLSKNKIIHSWIPPYANFKNVAKMKKMDFRTQHPYIHKDGSVVFTSGEGVFVKIDSCSRLVKVNSDTHFHHSININSQNQYIVPSRTYPKGKKPEQEFLTLLDSAGNIILSKNILDLLMDQYPDVLLSSQRAGDVLHLNDIEEIKHTDNYFDKGDLMFSFRNINTIMVTNKDFTKIKFLKAGPWEYQHDIDYHGDGIFTLFGNDTNISNKSTIYKYDYKNDTVSKLLSSEKIRSKTQGLHRYLKDGSLFIEVSDKRKIMFYGPNKNLLWEYVHNVDDDSISALHWSRYFLEGELDTSNIKCNKNAN
jgi:hypothetical protein